MPHIHEKIDFTVEVFIVHNKKVLLRKHDKYEKWLSVGGHIELDEDPNQAALREVKEEVGLNIELVGICEYTSNDDSYRELIAPIGLCRHRLSDTHEHVTFIYFARSKNDKVIPENTTDEWKWCKEEEIDLLKDIPEDIAYYAKRALYEVEVIHAPVVAGVVIKKNERYLLVQEKNPKAYKLWNFPAGRVDVGDTVEYTAVKEAKEETGYDVELVRKLGIFQESAEAAVKHAFEAKIIGGELNFSKDELLGAWWFTIDEVLTMRDQLRGPWILQAIEMVEGKSFT